MNVYLYTCTGCLLKHEMVYTVLKIGINISNVNIILFIIKSKYHDIVMGFYCAVLVDDVHNIWG